MEEYEFLLNLYGENKDFKSYVDKYIAHYNEGRSIRLTDGLTHALVREYALWLMRE